jgi:hypothetical protein
MRACQNYVLMAQQGKKMATKRLREEQMKIVRKAGAPGEMAADSFSQMKMMQWRYSQSLQLYNFFAGSQTTKEQLSTIGMIANEVHGRSTKNSLSKHLLKTSLDLTFQIAIDAISQLNQGMSDWDQINQQALQRAKDYRMTAARIPEPVKKAPPPRARVEPRPAPQPAPRPPVAQRQPAPSGSGGGDSMACMQRMAAGIESCSKACYTGNLHPDTRCSENCARRYDITQCIGR